MGSELLVFQSRLSRKTAYSETLCETTKTDETWETLADEFTFPDNRT